MSRMDYLNCESGSCVSRRLSGQFEGEYVEFAKEATNHLYASPDILYPQSCENLLRLSSNCCMLHAVKTRYRHFWPTPQILSVSFECPGSWDDLQTS